MSETVALIRPFDKTHIVRGKNIRLRAATPADAAFVFAMRQDAAKSRFLSPVQGSVDDQRAWLARCHADPAQLYFVIETSASESRGNQSEAAEALGLVRLYDPQGEGFCWGSWLIRAGAPSSTAIESALLVYQHALRLGFTVAHFDVRLGNTSVIRFHEGFGAVEIRRDATDIFFHIGLQAITAALQKYRRYLPSDITA